MRKTLFARPCMAAIALAAFVDMRTLERNKNINETLLMANVEALTEGEYSSSECPGQKIYSEVAVMHGEKDIREHDMYNLDICYTVTYTKCCAKGIGEKEGTNGIISMNYTDPYYRPCEGDSKHNYFTFP